MSERRIEIEGEPIGKGSERACYVHPDDPNKAIKISMFREAGKQNRRDVLYYRKLSRRRKFCYDHVPRFFGTVTTNLGEGVVVELMRDYDGEISKTLCWYLYNGWTVSDVASELEKVRRYLLEHLILINADLEHVVQRVTAEEIRLVIIDGLGDVTAIQWLNLFPFHVRSKIRRRFERFLRAPR